MLGRFHAAAGDAEPSADATPSVATQPRTGHTPPPKEPCVRDVPDNWEDMAMDVSADGSDSGDAAAAAGAHEAAAAPEALTAPEAAAAAEPEDLAVPDSVPEPTEPAAAGAEPALRHFNSSWRAQVDTGLKERMLEFRCKLPAYSMRDEIVAAVLRNQVVVIRWDVWGRKKVRIYFFNAVHALTAEKLGAARRPRCRSWCSRLNWLSGPPST